MSKPMVLVYLKTDNRLDGSNDWEEMVVCAESAEDALACCGKADLPKERVEAEVLGPADGDAERGIVCWGLHDHDDTTCMKDGCDKPAVVACAEHIDEVGLDLKINGEELSRRLREEREDLREVAANAAGAWERFATDPNPDTFLETGYCVGEIRYSLKNPVLPIEAYQDSLVGAIADASEAADNDGLAAFMVVRMLKSSFERGLVSRERARAALSELNLEDELEFVDGWQQHKIN